MHDAEQPPPEPEAMAAAAGKIRRGVATARLSGISLLVLAGLSTLVCLTDPISAPFAISLAVLANGVIEYRAAGALKRQRAGAVTWLIWNQLALGMEVAVFGLWQAQAMTPGRVADLLDQPEFSMVLAMYSPEQQELLRQILPGTLRVMYWLVSLVALAACGGCALFYRSRRKYLAVAPAAF